MRRSDLPIRCSVFALTISVTALFAFLGTALGAVSEAEPNNEQEQANDLSLGTDVEGLFADEDDVDWYRLKIEDAGKHTLRVTLTGVPEIDSSVSICDPEGERLKHYDMMSTGEGEEIVGFGVTQGTYYIRVAAYSGANNENVYTLKAELAGVWKEGEEWEPNDASEHANTVTLGEEISGLIHPDTDDDWYKLQIDVEERHLLRVDVTGVPDVDVRLEIYDAEGNLLRRSNEKEEEQPEAVINLGVTEGTYYISADAWDGCNKSDRYVLTATLVGPWKEGHEWELNETPENANELKLDETISAYLHPEGDVDCYAITVPEPGMGLLLIELSSLPDVDSQIELLDAEGEVLKTANILEEGGAESLVRMKAAPGTYYVSVSGYNSDMEQTYRLRAGAPAGPPPTPEEIGEALEKALDYLAGEQVEDGYWRGPYEESTGIAGLCLMAFVGAEELVEKYDRNIKAVTDFIKSKYHPSADYEAGSEEWARDGGLIYHHAGGYAQPYEHAMATLALIEAYVVLNDASLRPAIVDALGAIARWQNTEDKPKLLNGPIQPDAEGYGGWRYHPWTTDSDLSVTGWNILALKAGANAHLTIPEESLPRAAVFVRSCFDEESSSFQYMPRGGESCVATGVGVLGLQICGCPDDPLIAPAVRFMQDNPPVWEFEDPTYWHGWPFYYWYYGHRAMLVRGGDDWRIWKAWISRLLVENQNGDGSWEPAQKERSAGKAYTTALGALMLEMCAGHVPVYMRKAEDVPVVREDVPVVREDVPVVREDVPKKPGRLRIRFAEGAGKATVKNVELILDASNSMWDKVDGVYKIHIARDVLTKVVEELPESVHVGLRVFGSRYSSSDRRADKDTRLLAPIGPMDKPRLVETIQKIRPKGKTPLVYSILQAPGDFKELGSGTIIVVTDGEDTCGGDINAVAPALEKSGLGLRVNIVGFDIEGAEARKQLEAIAESTGGAYLDARNPEELLSSLQETLRVEFVLLDAENEEKARGTVGGEAVEVPEGTYTLRLLLDPAALEAEVVIVAEKESTLLLKCQEGEWTLVRSD